jgi:hypothetical protein
VLHGFVVALRRHLIIPVSAQSQPAALPHANFQLWPEIDVYIKIGSRIDLNLEAQGRLTPSLPNPEVYAFGTDVNVLISRYLTITPSYYHYRFDEPGNTVGYGHNVILAATAQYGLHHLHVEDRNRFVGVLTEGQEFHSTGIVAGTI